MPDRDAAEFNEASYEDDPATSLDSLSDHVRELVAHEVKNKLDARTLGELCRIVENVVKRLLDEERLGPQVEISKLSGRELLAQMIAEIIDASEPRLMARCVDFVFELGVQMGLNQTQIGLQEGVTKASVSRHCVHLKATYRSNKPSAGMKSAAAVKTYRHLRTGRSSRCPRMDWPFAEKFKDAYAAH